jgi:HEAT repeat protein
MRRLPLILVSAALVAILGCRVSLKPLAPVETVVAAATAGDEKALWELTRYFSSPVEGEDLRAFEVLIGAGDKAVDPLLEALEDDDPMTAEHAAGALGNIRAAKAVEPLTAALDRPGFPIYVAVWALGEIGDERAIPALVRHLGHKDVGIAKYSVKALVKFGHKSIPAAIAALDDANPRTRHYAMRVLGQSGSKEAAGAIRTRFGKLDREVALWALGKLGDREAFPLIEPEVNNADWRIRLAAVQALAMLQDPRAVPSLKRKLDDAEWVVREWAARGIEDITQERQLYRDQHGAMVVPYNLFR